MNNDLDMEELEQEQLDYIRRNYDKTSNIPNETDMNLDILEDPIDQRIVLTPEQEQNLLERMMLEQKKQMSKKDNNYSFSISSYFHILSKSFVNIMDDILNFNGNIEEISSILTKDDRLILIGTIIFIICVIFLLNNMYVKQP